MFWTADILLKEGCVTCIYWPFSFIYGPKHFKNEYVFVSRRCGVFSPLSGDNQYGMGSVWRQWLFGLCTDRVWSGTGYIFHQSWKAIVRFHDILEDKTWALTHKQYMISGTAGAISFCLLSQIFRMFNKLFVSFENYISVCSPQKPYHITQYVIKKHSTVTKYFIKEFWHVMARHDTVVFTITLAPWRS